MLGIIEAALLILIVALHLGTLKVHSLENNEFITLRVIQLPTWGQVIEERVTNNHMPGYFLLVRAWTSVFGCGEFALRFCSAVFSLIGIVALWRLGAHLAGRRMGLLALALAGLAQSNLQLSSDARMYSMLFMAAGFSLWGFIRYLDGGGARWLFILFLGGLIGLNSQLLYLLVPLTIAVYVAIRWRSLTVRRLPLFAAILAPILLITPLVVWWSRVQYKVGVDPQIHGIDIWNVFRNLATLFLGDPDYLSDHNEALALAWEQALLAGCLGLTLWRPQGSTRKPPASGSGAPVRNDRPLERHIALLWLWALLPTAMIALAGLKSDKNVIGLWRYYIIAGSAAPLLLMAMVASQHGLGRSRLARLLAACLLITIGAASVNYLRKGSSGLRETVQYIKPKLQPGDLVIASLQRRRTDAFHYYGLPGSRPTEVPEQLTTPEAILPWLTQTSAGHKRLWAVYYTGDYKKDALYLALKNQKVRFKPLLKKVRKAGEDTSLGLYEIDLPAQASQNLPTTLTLKANEPQR